MHIYPCNVKQNHDLESKMWQATGSSVAGLTGQGLLNAALDITVSNKINGIRNASREQLGLSPAVLLHERHRPQIRRS